MIKQIPLLLVVIGIAILLIGVNLVMSYGLTFFSGISLFFGSALLIAGVDLKRKIKKLNAKNRKAHHDYTISKLMEDDVSKEDENKDWSMDREKTISVAKLVSYLLIIVGIAILSVTIIYFLTAPISWLSYVGIIVGGLMLNIGAAAIFLIKKLKLDIKSSHWFLFEKELFL